MKLQTFRFTFMLFLVFLLGEAFGQPEQITLQEAINLALKQNVQMQTVRNQHEFTRTVKRQSYLEFLPNLSAGGGARRSSGRQFIQSEDRLVTQTTEGLDAGVQTNIGLFNGLKRVASVREAAFEDRAQSARVEQTEQDVIHTVLRQYIQILFDEELLRIDQENMKAQRDLLQQIRESVNLGLRSTPDLYRQQAEVARIEGNVIESGNTVQIDKSLLLQTIQGYPLMEYDVVIPDTSALMHLGFTERVDELVRRAWQSRSDYQRQQYLVRASRQALRAVRANYWPTLSLATGYGTNYIDISPRSFRDQFFKDNIQSYVGLNFSLPIFNRMTTHVQAIRQRINLRNTKLQAEDLKQSIAVDVKRAYLQYQSSQKQQLVSEAQLKAAEQALAAEREWYNVGASSFVDLSTANAQYVEAAANRVHARFMLVLRFYELEFSTGTLRPDLQVAAGDG